MRQRPRKRLIPAQADMPEAWLPKVINRWDAKEQRKKLKLASLRAGLPN